MKVYAKFTYHNNMLIFCYIFTYVNIMQNILTKYGYRFAELLQNLK